MNFIFLKVHFNFFKSLIINKNSFMKNLMGSLHIGILFYFFKLEGGMPLKPLFNLHVMVSLANIQNWVQYHGT